MPQEYQQPLPETKTLVLQAHTGGSLELYTVPAKRRTTLDTFIIFEKSSKPVDVDVFYRYASTDYQIMGFQIPADGHAEIITDDERWEMSAAYTLKITTTAAQDVNILVGGIEYKLPQKG